LLKIGLLASWSVSPEHFADCNTDNVLLLFFLRCRQKSRTILLINQFTPLRVLFSELPHVVSNGGLQRVEILIN
jgi:hypothetical protein